ncbi:MAG: class I SAM-dependent methyltransferase [Candidatus Methanospirareceae archaeon]
MKTIETYKYILSFDEGYGTAYERFAFDNFVASMIKRYKISKVLEMPADGIMGIPGIKSMIFARGGCEVTVAHPSKRILKDAKEIWKAFGLEAEFVRSYWINSPFKNNSFDLVWNFCVYEHFRNHKAVVEEMLRITRKYIFIEIQNVFNIGFLVHRLYHFLRREPWDHGKLRRMKINDLERVIKEAKADIVEIGATDMPPWPDINIKAEEMLKGGRGKENEKRDEIRPEVKLKPIDKLLEDISKPEDNSNSILYLFNIWYNLERRTPTFLKKFFAHHPYVIAKKKFT